MAENPTQPIFEIDLAERGGRLVFKTPEELRQWNTAEQNKWLWLADAGRPMTEWLANSRHDFFSRLENFGEHWRRYVSAPTEIHQAFNSIKTTFEEFPKKSRVLLSTTPAAVFVFQLKEKRGDKVAAGAYAAVLNAQINTGGSTQSEFFEGIVEAFLFKREIEWTASGHQHELNRLKTQYDGEIARQDTRFKEIQEANRALNGVYDTALKEKNEALQKLHENQSSEFTKLIEKHVQNLAAIEKTYDQKLALRRPVKYWEVKEGYHRKRAVTFGVVALVSASVAAGGLGLLAYEYLGKLQPTENPKHWQIGLLVIGAFFAIWLVRVFVRLFFSHVHLATDAAERRMMILTYLSMSREGAQFAAEDKKLIVQHIFRAASDGLVKDDAAPPSFFEALTRR
ncbi:MAG: hypothetical protein EPO07_04510 [Verrucomicrobia bacterium]|nr:MAG: hypothetical protein EPO07_04510 [Verrucomicrobiota bacterium]